MNKKYNGMYQSTSKIQDKIFNALYDAMGRLQSGITGSIDFNQKTGNVNYCFMWKNGNCIYSHFDYKGNVIL